MVRSPGVNRECSDADRKPGTACVSVDSSFTLMMWGGCSRVEECDGVSVWFLAEKKWSTGGKKEAQWPRPVVRSSREYGDFNLEKNGFRVRAC